MSAAADWIHEARIRILGSVCNVAMLNGNDLTARQAWNDMRDAIAQRSPEQVRAMEARMGLLTKGPAAG